MINQPIQPQARQPRGVVKINGVRTQWVSWELDNNAFYQADTFRVKLALSAQPDPTIFASASELDVEIFAGFPADPANYTEAELKSLIYGLVDDVTYDPVQAVVELSGRDFTSVLVDTKTTDKWPNLTASQIAEQIAKAHDLTPVVTATTAKVGTYYEIDHARLSTQRSEWDVLTYLANEEGYMVYVRGRELHFEPRPSPDAEPYVLTWQAPTTERGHAIFDGKSVMFSRNLTLAKDVTVYVRSWNAKNNQGFTQKAKSARTKNTVLKKAAQPIGEPQVYTFNIPGLTPEQALQRAQSLLREITAHEVKMTAHLPADNVLDITKMIQVVGTGTAFDQMYYPDSIIRQMSLSDGYQMTIHGKNHSPESVVQA